MKTIRSYFIAVGSLIMLSGSAWALTLPDNGNVGIALDAAVNDMTRLAKSAQTGDWAGALWNAERSGSGLKEITARLFEPNESDYGTPEATRRLEINRHIAAFINKIGTVLSTAADNLKRLASRDILEFKTYKMTQRLEEFKDAVKKFVSESGVDIGKVASLVKQYRLSAHFSPEFVEQMQRVKSMFIIRAQEAQNAIENGFAQLKTELESAKERTKGLRDRLLDVFETTE